MQLEERLTRMRLEDAARECRETTFRECMTKEQSWGLLGGEAQEQRCSKGARRVCDLDD
jgi:hypothetical protein